MPRFADGGTNDHQVWAWIMKTVKPDTVDAVLQEAHDRVSESLNGHHQGRGSAFIDGHGTPSNRTPDIITEYEDGRNIHPNSASDPISQFTAVAEEDGQSTGEDDYMPESLFSLANVKQGIRAYSYDSISFNELCSVLLTDTPAIHVQTVQATLRTLTPGHVNMKTLDALFQKLQEEAALARRVVD
ncbi:hypothetical protein BDR07DRAFT_1378816 [Suillus spraguei]|nr:hypothetical protein BDR07DRAFT_1382610 [Suillus spraguei]KAG2359316.1 hypothetical protein BDR07DRAFT_1378816 [Suillus spraguei]